MPTTISSKGQTVIPKHVRKALGLSTGSVVEFILEGDSARIVPVRKRKPTTVEEGFGMLKYDGPPLAVDDMDVALLLRRERR
jgi:AbrB family looped-hinge helix DNA binding protein